MIKAVKKESFMFLAMFNDFCVETQICQVKKNFTTLRMLTQHSHITINPHETAEGSRQRKQKRFFSPFLRTYQFSIRKKADRVLQDEPKGEDNKLRNKETEWKQWKSVVDTI